MDSKVGIEFQESNHENEGTTEGNEPTVDRFAIPNKKDGDDNSVICEERLVSGLTMKLVSLSDNRSNREAQIKFFKEPTLAQSNICSSSFQEEKEEYCVVPGGNVTPMFFLNYLKKIQPFSFDCMEDDADIDDCSTKTIDDISSRCDDNSIETELLSETPQNQQSSNCELDRSGGAAITPHHITDIKGVMDSIVGYSSFFGHESQQHGYGSYSNCMLDEIDEPSFAIDLKGVDTNNPKFVRLQYEGDDEGIEGGHMSNHRNHCFLIKEQQTKLERHERILELPVSVQSYEKNDDIMRDIKSSDTPPCSMKTTRDSSKKSTKEPKTTPFIGEWGHFTVSDSARYYDELQMQVNIYKQSAKRRPRFKIKNAASLLVAKSPSCGAEAIYLIKSDTKKRRNDRIPSNLTHRALIETCSMNDLLYDCSPKHSFLARLSKASRKNQFSNYVPQNDDSLVSIEDEGRCGDTDADFYADSSLRVQVDSGCRGLSTSLIRTTFCELGTDRITGAANSTLPERHRIDITPVVSANFIREALKKRIGIDEEATTFKFDECMLLELGLGDVSSRRESEILFLI